MDFVFSPPTQPSLPVAGKTARFPVRRIWCVGRNYAEHAREFGHDPEREPPFFFSKPADALLTDGQGMPYPPRTHDLHFEAELVVALGTGGQDIPRDAALEHVWGMRRAMTSRDVIFRPRRKSSDARGILPRASTFRRPVARCSQWRQSAILVADGSPFRSTAHSGRRPIFPT